MAKSGGRGGDSRDSGRGSSSDRDALERAFADVKPLGKGTRKRVMPAPSAPALRRPPRGAGPEGASETLLVEREGNGLVLGKRRSTHASILDALEDPKLIVDDECDLHGQTKREAEREVLRFVRDAQQDGKRWVLIIVGKGLHSPGGKGALKTSIVQALSSRGPARYVLAFRTAPRHLGGNGALVARLVDRL